MSEPKPYAREEIERAKWERSEMYAIVGTGETEAHATSEGEKP